MNVILELPKVPSKRPNGGYAICNIALTTQTSRFNKNAPIHE